MKRSFEAFHSENTRSVRTHHTSSRTHLDVSDIYRFDGNFPVFQLPKLIGSFSLDNRRKYHNDNSELRYISLPGNGTETTWKVHFDLTVGVENAIEKDSDAIKNHMLDDLLTWIVQERKLKNPMFVDGQSPQQRVRGIDFVCFRGLLTLIIATPYESRAKDKSWKLVATRYQNIIYLWQIKEEDDERRSFRHNPLQHQMSIWGFKFEQYLCAGLFIQMTVFDRHYNGFLTDSENSEPDPKQQLDTNAEFCCVLKTRLGNHHLLYGAEIDAVKKNCRPPWNNLQDFVELKTNRFIENERQQGNFKRSFSFFGFLFKIVTYFYGTSRFKLLKWWAQSFLVGIPTVVCGYRNDRGIVSKLESIPVKNMPSMAKVSHFCITCYNYLMINVAPVLLSEYLQFFFFWGLELYKIVGIIWLSRIP